MTNFYDLKVTVIYRNGNTGFCDFNNLNSSEYNEIIDKFDYLKKTDDFIEDIKIKEDVWTY